jgi:cyclase
MGRVLVGIVSALAVALAVGVIYVHDRVTSLEAEQVTGDVHMVRGLGGNVGVLRTGAGAVVVDTMTFRIQGERIRELAERLTGGPIQAVINTHYHADHSHGNPGFAPGTRVVATQRTRDYLLAFDASYWDGKAADTLPGDLFEQDYELRIGDKTIRSIHPGRGHTGGDLVVLFVEDRLLHMGDLLFSGRYPNIDLEAGGSVREWIGTLDRVLELDFDRVIPGHGPVTDREGVRAFQRFLREVWSAGEEAAREGLSLEETLARAQLSEDEGYGVTWMPFVFRLDRDFVIRRVWEEATGAVVPLDVPSSWKESEKR